MPAISVLVPVRNAAPWLDASFASLARQTWGDFEIVAVDDGSTDDSAARLERIARREPRLRLIRTPPRGLPAALATALAAAEAPLIARHDADDVSHRDRLALQASHLAAHADVAVVGCRVRLFPDAAVSPGMRRWARWHNALLDHEAMRHEALVDSPLAHGTALIRRDALERAGGWIERGWAEDVDLWLRMLERGATFAKLPRALYGWRQHAGSATRRDPRYRPERYAELRLHHLRRGFLRRRRTVTLIAVGATLERWTDRLRACDLAVVPVAAGRPAPTFQKLAPPLLLAFGMAAARGRWRVALRSRSLVEGRDFAFVA